MRHKYDTRAIVLSRAPVGESSSFVTLLTPELGLVRALAQSVRAPGAKLAPALATFAESSVVLIRGRDGWRLSGAVLEENWFKRLEIANARRRAARVSGLLLRLVAGEAQDSALFPVMSGFFSALSELPEDMHEATEMLAALRTLSALGLDAGEIPGESSAFTPDLLATIAKGRANYIARINQGIEASGL
ncbi:MAG: recombination protein O N-terminal domain-containing protein [Minisyncoccia bacterium]